jgi:hypothetical protein
VAGELDAPRLKVRRANDHLVALDRRVKRFVKSETYETYAEYNPKTTEHLLRLRIVKKPRLDVWAAVAGDVVHNLRSALDHVVWELTIRNRGTKPAYPLTSDWKRIEFPIFRLKRDFHGAPSESGTNPFPYGSGLYKIRGVDPRLHALFDCLQPFHDGPRRDRNTLQILHELDIIDKHRHIPVLASVVAPEEIEIFPDRVLPAFASAIRIDVVEVFKPGPFQDGTPLAGFSQSGKFQVSSYALPMHVEPKLSFDVQLEKGRPTMGEPLLPTLGRMIKRVEEIIDLFEAAI